MTIEPRVQAALDAAMNQIRTAASAAAMRVAEHLGALAQAATKIADRDQIVATQQEMRRNMGAFQVALHEALRERVTKELEPFCAQKHKSLDARVRVIGPASEIHALVDNADELADLFIVSAVDVVDEPGEPRVEVQEHGGHRCERCWKWFEALAAEPNDVCDRCADALGALKA